MITKFMTEIQTRFNPFSPCAKPARLFLTFLPPNARSQGIAINTALLPRTSQEPSSVSVKFSTFVREVPRRNLARECRFAICKCRIANLGPSVQRMASN